jgi:Cft2 family RNA processing exonuclease
MNEIPRVTPRMLDQLPVIPPRDDRHEETPYVPPAAKSSGQQIIETTIGHVDKVTELTLDTLDKLEAEIAKTREIVQTSKLQVHDALRSHMIISETAMQSTMQIARELLDATSKLTVRNGK